MTGSDMPLEIDKPGSLIILRAASEVCMKGQHARQHFAHQLQANVAEALSRRGIDHQLTGTFGRLFLQTNEPDRALQALPTVFGLASFSQVEATTDATLEAIVRAGAERFTERVRGKTFAVRARRHGQHPFRSPDVERTLGAALCGPGRVDLESPEVTVFVEVVGTRAYLSSDKRQGANGLPAGVQGKAVALISGGFDSAVAAWRVLKRGASMDYVFCNLAGRANERLVLQVVKKLGDTWALGQRPYLHVIDFNPVVRELRARVKRTYWQVVLKRLMLRSAEAVCLRTGADAIVTGESLAQVSSQTMPNLRAIDACINLPVLRPLVGCDKVDIIAEARRLGTAAISEHVREHCALAGGQPVVAAVVERVDAQEACFDQAILRHAIDTRRKLDILKLSPSDLCRPYLFTKDIPGHAVVIDCQPQDMFERWHVPGAFHHDPMKLAHGFGSLDPAKTYVLYCAHGTHTPYLAELMQQAGYDAYAFEGGLQAVREAVSAGACACAR